MKTPPILASILLASFCSSCGGDDGGDDGGGGGGGADAGADVSTYSVTGSVVDFTTGEPLDSATVSTNGLSPAPTISTTGADFTVEGVAPHSVFYLLAGSPPDYRNTYSNAIDVRESDLSGVIAEAISEAYLADLIEGFAVEPAAGTGVLLARVVDEAGTELEGIPAAAFALEGADGPYFLDADRQPAPALEATSASGYVVFFDVPPGDAAVAAAPGSDYTMTMAVSPVAATAVTLGAVEVLRGEEPLPEDVSFSGQVVPIFEDRGCTLCHSGGGPGKDLGNLHLDGGENLIYRELTEELSPKHGVPRVNLESPAESLLLTQPSREEPPDDHPNVTFASPQDPDYRILLVWIQEGALQN